MKYKLLKDTPRLKAGSIGELSYTSASYLKNSKEAVFFKIDSDEGNTECFSKELVESTPEWFEPVIERWRASHGETYYIFNGRLFSENVRDGRRDLDNHFFESGNYFRTKDQAIEARNRINKCLMDYHKELGE